MENGSQRPSFTMDGTRIACVQPEPGGRTLAEMYPWLAACRKKEVMLTFYWQNIKNVRTYELGDIKAERLVVK